MGHPGHYGYRVCYNLAIKTRHDIAAAIYRFRPFGRPAHRNRRHPHDTAFFLYGTTVRQSAASMPLQQNEVKKPNGS